MKLLVVFVLVAAVAAAPPASRGNSYPTDNVQVLRYENAFIDPGNYKYSFEQSDGTKAEQQGELINEGREDASLVVRGRFSWIGPDGFAYVVNYVADKNGYQPEIEEGPGVPPAVVASLLG